MTDRIEVNDAVKLIEIAKSIKADTEQLWLEQGLPPKEVKTVSYNFETETISVS